MTPVSPDVAAASEHADPLVRDLTDNHIGMTIRVLDSSDPTGLPVAGELAFCGPDTPTGLMSVGVRQPEVQSGLITHLLVPSDTPYQALSGPAEPPIRPVDLDRVRELAAVSDKLKSTKGQIKDLERHKKSLSDDLVQDFIANGLTKMSVSGRTSYVHTATYAEYNDRPDGQGGKYTDADLIPVLEAMGRGELIKPRSVHPGTLASLLREFRDSGTPVPDALAKIVKLSGNPEIRVLA